MQTFCGDNQINNYYCLENTKMLKIFYSQIINYNSNKKNNNTNNSDNNNNNNGTLIIALSCIG